LAEYLDLADYLLIAEAVLDVPAEAIARWPGIGLAESALHAPAAAFEGVELYPDVIDKAAVLCVRLARNHPLPDGNKRVAYLALVEFLARNNVEWSPPSVDETIATIERVAAGEMPEPELAEWLEEDVVLLDPTASRR
jgi:death on curing protein